LSTRFSSYWREAGVAEPSFVVVNPQNGHAHVVYLLRGWIRTDGSSDSDLAAVRYMVAIERAYTRALRADAGYAALVHHNPFHPVYETHGGRDEPYSLRELAARVELPRMVPRRSTEIRTDGRNVETFDRLRHWGVTSRNGNFCTLSRLVAEGSGAAEGSELRRSCRARGPVI